MSVGLRQHALCDECSRSTLIGRVAVHPGIVRRPRALVRKDRCKVLRETDVGSTLFSTNTFDTGIRHCRTKHDECHNISPTLQDYFLTLSRGVDLRRGEVEPRPYRNQFRCRVIHQRIYQESNMAQANDVQTTTESRRENGEQRKHDHELRELAARENIGQDLERIRDRVELALHEAHGARQQAQQSRSRAQQAHNAARQAASQANQASQSAQQAHNQANQAAQQAQQAQNEANQANQRAQQAHNQANQAAQQAQQAQNEANQANQRAQQAEETSEQANQQAQQAEDQAARTFDLANEADQLAQHARHNARHLQHI